MMRNKPGQSPVLFDILNAKPNKRFKQLEFPQYNKVAEDLSLYVQEFENRLILYDAKCFYENYSQ